ncbi:SDR family NAD(P)-dependent oxidoreductase [Gilvimarinus polysaccharolyticus]|uniref:SDR family NAD(P)-dependent oxidoreductase n=1 Tax=Gilvimarinus polysaccharolyticus TaxID=863921 RepID=UPI00067374F4|nr:SDR family NAD(P)-dependent oxidoreductase [Gilvimarinus polysaccharolyticus]
MNTTIITGTSRGIGLELVRQYLNVGKHVVASHRPGSISAELAAMSATHPELSLLPLDLACDQSIAKFSHALHSHSIELLINNAGTTNHVEYGQWTRRHFLDSYTTNAAGPALLIQALDQQLCEAAKIVQLSSGLASLHENINPTGAFEEYAMSKVALNMLTRRLAMKLAGRNIIVSAISPGWVQTEMGGPDAPTSAEAVSQQILQSINKLSIQHNGTFLEADLTPIAW